MAAHSSSSGGPSSSAVRALALELKSLVDDPLEGIRTKLVNDEDLFQWEVALFGPPDTLYQGGYFKVRKRKGKRLVLSPLLEIYDSLCANTPLPHQISYASHR